MPFSPWISCTQEFLNNKDCKSPPEGFAESVGQEWGQGTNMSKTSRWFWCTACWKMVPCAFLGPRITWGLESGNVFHRPPSLASLRWLHIKAVSWAQTSITRSESLAVVIWNLYFKWAPKIHLFIHLRISFQYSLCVRQHSRHGGIGGCLCNGEEDLQHPSPILPPTSLRTLHSSSAL